MRPWGRGLGAGMKKREIRRVLDKAVNALDGAHVVTGGPKGDSEEALAIKRRAEDMVGGAMLGLAVAAVLLDDDVPDMGAGDVVDAVMTHVAGSLGARADGRGEDAEAAD